LERARLHIEKGAWQQARALLEKAVALAPEPRGSDGPHAVLAGVYRKLGMAPEERRLLEQLADQSSDAIAAYRRLLEIAEEKQDRTLQAKNAERLLSVNPMLEAGWRGRGQALEAAGATGDRASQAGAVTAYERLLLLQPADQADVRLRLAKLLKHKDRRAAKRHLLEALAEAPRLRAGHQLLLELAGPSAGSAP
jgi:tetratricopeptide (TPR) repeat protein